MVSIIEMEYRSGRGPREISQDQGISTNTIRSLIRRKGWAGDRKEIRKLAAEIIVREYSENLARKQIEAREFYARSSRRASIRILKLLEVETDAFKAKSLVEALQSARKGEFACYDVKEEKVGDHVVGGVIINFPDTVKSWVGIPNGTEI